MSLCWVRPGTRDISPLSVTHISPHHLINCPLLNMHTNFCTAQRTTALATEMQQPDSCGSLKTNTFQKPLEHQVLHSFAQVRQRQVAKQQHPEKPNKSCFNELLWSSSLGKQLHSLTPPSAKVPHPATSLNHKGNCDALQHYKQSSSTATFQRC